MRADELKERYSFEGHEEHGQYLETHYHHTGEGRALSGSMYYYVGKNEKTIFHRIDCDEYWVYNAGSDLEIWVIYPNGDLIVSKLGTGKNSNPAILVPKGTIFATKHAPDATDSTFVTCVTVPRFEYKALELFDIEELKKKYPLLENF